MTTIPGVGSSMLTGQRRPGLRARLRRSQTYRAMNFNRPAHATCHTLTAQSHTSASGSGVADTDPARASIAIVFVHGLGSQSHGRTLFEMGDPLVRWLNRWLGGTFSFAPAAVGLRYDRVVLDDPSEPAHALVDVATEGNRKKWLLLESRWAESFHQAGFIGTLRWGVTSGYFAALHHLATSLERLVDTHWERVSGAIPILVGVPLIVFQALAAGIVVQLIALVIVGLAAVPIGPVQRAAGSARLWLAESIGDATQLSSTHFQYAGMATRLSDDIGWATDRADKVVVVAHSAGAAVAVRALAPPLGPSIATLVTIGAGISKLRAITDWTTFQKWAAAAVLMAGVASPIAAWWVLGLQRGVPDAPFEWFVGAGAVAVMIVGLLALIEVFGQVRRAQVQPFDLSVTAGEWLDFYASRDPVPNGPLTRNPTEQLATDEVWNRDSLIRDHTSYWGNREGFVAPLGLHLLGQSGIAVPQGDTDRVNRARDRRKWRFERRRTISVGLIALTVSALALWRNELQEIGSSAIAAFDGNPVVLWVVALLVALIAPLPAFVGAALANLLEAEWIAPLVGALVIVAVMTAFRVAVDAVFMAWAWSDEQRLLARSPPNHAGWFVAGLGGLAAAGIVAVGALAGSAETFAFGYRLFELLYFAGLFTIPASILIRLLVGRWRSIGGWWSRWALASALAFVVLGGLELGGHNATEWAPLWIVGASTPIIAWAIHDPRTVWRPIGLAMRRIGQINTGSRRPRSVAGRDFELDWRSLGIFAWGIVALVTLPFRYLDRLPAAVIWYATASFVIAFAWRAFETGSRVDRALTLAGAVFALVGLVLGLRDYVIGY